MANVADPKQYKGYRSDKMVFVQQDKALHDTKFETKPISYLRGCWRRFCRNKGSIVAGIILLFVLSFAIFAPLGSSRTVDWHDANYAFVTPKSPLFEGTGFWDGTEEKKIYESEYNRYNLYDTEEKPIVELKEKGKEIGAGKQVVDYYRVRLDTYAVGAFLISATPDQIQSIREWEASSGKKVMLPVVDYTTYVDEYFENAIASGYIDSTVAFTMKSNLKNQYSNNHNIWYKLYFPVVGGKLSRTAEIDFDANGNVKPLYAKDASGDYIYTEQIDTDGKHFYLRVDYNNYYQFLYGERCTYLFGANANGYDIFVRLASGARLSLLLGVGVSIINLFLGLIWGSISGYYGGTVDLIMERIMRNMFNQKW